MKLKMINLIPQTPFSSLEKGEKSIDMVYKSPLSNLERGFRGEVKKRILFLFFVLCLLMTACEGQPTPFPAQIATATPDESVIANTPTSATQAPTIRYAIDPSLAHIPVQLDGNYQIINATEPIFADDLGISYDIAISASRIQGWQESPIPLSIGLILRPSADFSDIIWRAIDPPAFIQELGGITPLHDGTTPVNILRTDMANLGKPDGFTVTMGILGIDGEYVVRNQLLTLLIETKPIPISIENRLATWESGEIDLMLVSWFTDAEKAEWISLVGEAHFLPLYSFGIGYIVRPDLAISLSAQGLPQVDD